MSIDLSTLKLNLTDIYTKLISMSIWRKIWSDAYGAIPVDENGVTYEIHHVDGNKKNNNLSNLQCVSIQEHYDIHYRQGDWMACHMISERLSITLDARLELNAKISQNKIGVKGRTYTQPKQPCQHCNVDIGKSGLLKHERSCKANPNRVVVDGFRTGVVVTAEARQKMRDAKIGKSLSKDHRANIGKGNKGRIAWNKGKKYNIPD